jgi:addiction module HigA family antidote
MKTKIRNIHPGEILLEEFMKPAELNQLKLAKATGIPQSRLSSIISGKRSITAETAILIGRFFGTTPDMWLGLQNHYDLRMAQIVVGERASKLRTYKQLQAA